MNRKWEVNPALSLIANMDERNVEGEEVLRKFVLSTKRRVEGLLGASIGLLQRLEESEEMHSSKRLASAVESLAIYRS